MLAWSPPEVGLRSGSRAAAVVSRPRRPALLSGHAIPGGQADVPVCVLDATFKPGSDDVRDSPALDVARILHGMRGRSPCTTRLR
jgi:hypothetical protein